MSGFVVFGRGKLTRNPMTVNAAGSEFAKFCLMNAGECYVEIWFHAASKLGRWIDENLHKDDEVVVRAQVRPKTGHAQIPSVIRRIHLSRQGNRSEWEDVRRKRSFAALAPQTPPPCAGFYKQHRLRAGKPTAAMPVLATPQTLRRSFEMRGFASLSFVHEDSISKNE